MSRADAWLKSSESDSKTEAVEAWWPVDHDKTASCSCLVQKSKNFVSRARNTPLRSVFLSAWEAKVSWACSGPSGSLPVPLFGWPRPRFQIRGLRDSNSA